MASRRDRLTTYYDSKQRERGSLTAPLNAYGNPRECLRQTQRGIPAEIPRERCHGAHQAPEHRVGRAKVVNDDYRAIRFAHAMDLPHHVSRIRYDAEDM